MDYSSYYGIFGGTFDPIHKGHIMLARAALNELNLQKVILMPAYIPPHKRDLIITSDEHRYNMVNIAIQNENGFMVSDMEMRLKGDSYTARTLTLLYEQYSKLVFIVGADSFMALDTWYHPEIIFSKAVITCAFRDKYDVDALNLKADYYKRTYNADCHFLNMPYVDISSTQIRHLLKANEDVSGYLPDGVYEYIKENSLYIQE